jgi:AcrR family transcriptional regulator
MASAHRSPTPAPPVQERGRAAHLGPERRRPLVLDAALSLFVERGYRGTSMEAIATAAGVTKPVVYDCYPSKEQLFRALLDREEQRLLEEIGSALPERLDQDDVEDVLAGTFAAILTAAMSAPDSWRVLFDSEHAAEPLVARRVRRARESVVARLVTLVEPVLLEAGVGDAGRKAPVLAELLASIGEAGVRILLVRGEDWNADELSELLGRIAVRGFAAA